MVDSPLFYYNAYEFNKNYKVLSSLIFFFPIIKGKYLLIIKIIGNIISNTIKVIITECNKLALTILCWILNIFEYRTITILFIGSCTHIIIKEFFPTNDNHFLLSILFKSFETINVINTPENVAIKKK